MLKKSVVLSGIRWILLVFRIHINIGFYLLSTFDDRAALYQNGVDAMHRVAPPTGNL
jgi:hypothetical protein